MWWLSCIGFWRLKIVSKREIVKLYEGICVGAGWLLSGSDGTFKIPTLVCSKVNGLLN